jgi:lysophospholipid acyltransferase (LPLAT)-like uncharacterized protein
MGNKGSEIRDDRKAKVLGTIAGWLMRCWSRTLRFEIIDQSGVITPGNIDTPVIFALWHNRIFTIPPIWWRTGGNFRKTVVLTSASHDGSMLAHAMAVFGLGAVRGSSSRRGVAALVGMKRSLREGCDVCITPDGPRGPRYHFQPGVVKLAESAKTPIIPIHAAYESAWRLKTWDRFVIPKPFSRVKVTFGEMIHVAPGLDETAFSAECDRIQAILLAGADDLEAH